MRTTRFVTVAMGLLFGLVAVSLSVPAGAHGNGDDGHQIDHLVVIYEENHSFDNLWGLWPGVNGIKNADAAHTTQVGQTDARSPLACLLQLDVNLASPPLGSDCSGGTKADGSSFNSHFKNQPFPIDDYIPAMGDKSKPCYVPTP